MKTINTSEQIKLNSTFIRLSTGASTITDVIAQRAAVRSKEDSFVRRHKNLIERADLFGMNFCH
jgi:hypothetical protein